MSTKEKLAQALQEASAPLDMIERAKAGYYDDYESELYMPICQLVVDCRKNGLDAMAKRSEDGEFDATREEADAWFQKEGIIFYE